MVSPSADKPSIKSSDATGNDIPAATQSEQKIAWNQPKPARKSRRTPDGSATPRGVGGCIMLFLGMTVIGFGLLLTLALPPAGLVVLAFGAAFMALGKYDSGR
jgi:hypothetical protein